MYALAAVVILLIVTDLALRLIFGLGDSVLYQHDAACGYLPVPNQHVRRFFCRNDINAFSMRSADVSLHKPPGTLRILFLGDSVTYGTTHIDQSKIFTHLLAEDLPRQLHRPVEILNASTGAWAVGNELGYLKSRGTFEADQVIFVLNTGDLTQPFEPGVLSSRGGYPDHEPLCALSELWVRYLYPRLVRSPEAHDAGSQAADAPAAAVAKELPGVLADLATAQTLAQRTGASFGIVYSPARGGRWDDPAYAHGLQILKNWATAHDVPLLDLAQPYATRPAGEVYQDGIHLRDEGNRLAADALEKQWSWPTGDKKP